MTDKELIAEAREAVDYRDDTGWFWVGRLADALEVSLGERDAAVAAIERVRAVLSAWEMVQARNREYLESGNPGMIVPIDCTGGLRAALDGAPEPDGIARAVVEAIGGESA